MDQNDFNDLSEKCGYLKCQIDTTSVILEREKELYRAIKILRSEIEELQGLKRRDKTSELLRLSGELEALRNLWIRISSLTFAKAEAN